MKIYEKPMAIVNKFEVADVIAASAMESEKTKAYVADSIAATIDANTQGVIFQW